MNVHKNDRTDDARSSELVRRVREGQTPRAAATALGVDIKTVKKWVLRFEAEGAAGLADRSSQPRRLNRPTTNDVCAHFAGLRRWRRSPVSSQWKSTVSISFDVGSPSKKSALFALIGKAILSAIGKAILLRRRRVGLFRTARTKPAPAGERLVPAVVR